MANVTSDAEKLERALMSKKPKKQSFFNTGALIGGAGGFMIGGIAGGVGGAVGGSIGFNALKEMKLKNKVRGKSIADRLNKRLGTTKVKR